MERSADMKAMALHLIGGKCVIIYYMKTDYKRTLVYCLHPACPNFKGRGFTSRVIIC